MPIEGLRANSDSQENLENYLNSVAQAKQQLSLLGEKIQSLMAKREVILSENSELFAEQRDRIRAQKAESDKLLSDAKRTLIAAEEKFAEAKKRYQVFESLENDHYKNVSQFKDDASRKQEELKAALKEVYLQKESNELAAADNLKFKGFLAEVESKLNLRQSAIEQKEKEITESLLHVNSEKERLQGQIDLLNKQSEKIHAEIENDRKDRTEDIAKLQSLSDEIKSDKRNNENILRQIEDKSQSLQDKVLNMKLLSNDIDRQKNELIAKQEKTSEMISRLQQLKDELSKDNLPAKSEEVSK